MPIATIGQPRNQISGADNSPASNSITAAASNTCFAGTRPELVILLGPSRCSVSLPFNPSTASLKKFVAICKQMQLPNVANINHTQNAPLNFQPNTDPARTGATAAPSVFGLDAKTQCDSELTMCRPAWRKPPNGQKDFRFSMRILSLQICPC